MLSMRINFGHMFQDIEDGFALQAHTQQIRLSADLQTHGSVD